LRSADSDIGVSYTILSVALFGGMVAFIAFLEIMFPWVTELKLTSTQAVAIETARSTGSLSAWYTIVCLIYLIRMAHEELGFLFEYNKCMDIGGRLHIGHQ
jgi:hypothetical protein